MDLQVSSKKAGPIGRQFRSVFLLMGAMVSMLLTGCPEPTKVAPVSSPQAVCIEATVAYYYRYKDTTPNQSDIAFIEPLRGGQRCVAVSNKTAPVYPDTAITSFVQNGTMKIDTPPAVGTSHVSASVATIAVYYKGDGETASSRIPLAVEDLTKVQRDIETAAITTPDIRTSCGLCRSYRCDSMICCMKAPC